MPGWIGPGELLLLLLVVLLVFGPKRLPEMGRSLGRGMREFKDSITGDHNDPDPIQALPVSGEAPATRACSDCGKNNSRDARYCDGCGARLDNSCPNCRQDNAPDANYCNACGTPLAATAVTDPS